MSAAGQWGGERERPRTETHEAPRRPLQAPNHRDLSVLQRAAAPAFRHRLQRQRGRVVPVWVRREAEPRLVHRLLGSCRRKALEVCPLPDNGSAPCGYPASAGREGEAGHDRGGRGARVPLRILPEREAEPCRLTRSTRSSFRQGPRHDPMPWRESPAGHPLRVPDPGEVSAPSARTCFARGRHHQLRLGGHT